MTEAYSSDPRQQIATQQSRLVTAHELVPSMQAHLGEEAAQAAGLSWNDVVHGPAGDSAASTSDTTYTVFKAAGMARQKPAVAAAAVAEALPKESVRNTQVVAGHVNVAWAGSAIADRAVGLAHYGLQHRPVQQARLAVIDYASPNIAKPLGVNHLRSTVLGAVLSNLLTETGYAVIKDNHLGDWGTQFGHLLAAYDRHGDKPFSDYDLDDLNVLYVQASADIKADETLRQEGRKRFARLQAGDQQEMTRWRHAVAVTMQAHETGFQRLGVTFDTAIGESYFDKRSNTLLEQLLAVNTPGVVRNEDGSVLLQYPGLAPVMARTSDGYPVYAARDLATIEQRVQDYDPDTILYVVGSEQRDNFRGVFAAAQAGGLAVRANGTTADLEHIEFGLYLGANGQKLSTRKGSSGSLMGLMDELETAAIDRTRDRSDGRLSEAEIARIGKVLARGALFFTDCTSNRTGDVRFDPKVMVSDGSRGVLNALYAVARSGKLLHKAAQNGIVFDQSAPLHIGSDAERHLVMQLDHMPTIIKRAADERAPHHLAQAITGAAAAYNAIYTQFPVTSEPDAALRQGRLAYTQAVNKVLRHTLGILNIEPLDSM